MPLSPVVEEGEQRPSRNQVAVCVDFGSTFTKASLVDLAEGRIVASASHPTTLPTPGTTADVLDGYDACLAALVEQDRRAADAEVLACSSAGGGLRMGVVGLVEDLTAEAARQAALGAGARVLGVLSGGLDDAAAARRLLAEVSNKFVPAHQYPPGQPYPGYDGR